MSEPRIRVTRIEAARRQLNTAIELWFLGADPVSVHALAAGSHQILNDLNRAAKGPELIFGTSAIPPEERQAYITSLKSPINFLKHADQRKGNAGKKPLPEDEISFPPVATLLLMWGSLGGLHFLDRPFNKVEMALLTWLVANRIDWFDEQRRTVLEDRIPIDHRLMARNDDRRAFFKQFVSVR